ncbi:fimbrial protein [Bacteroides sp.]
MRAIYFITVISLIALFTSCDNNGMDERMNPAEKTARLELTITGTAANTRSTGATLPNQTDENTIDNNDLWVGVFNADGTVNAIEKISLGTGAKATIGCSPSNGCTVMVVANTGIDFSGISTKSVFESKTVALSHTAVSGSQVATQLPMSGETTGVNLVEGATPVAVTVSLRRLVARISIDKVETKFSATGQFKDATFKVTKVFLYNALETSKVAAGATATTLPATPTWLHKAGLVTENPADTYTWMTAQEVPYLLHQFAETDITTAPHTAKYWFYAFANDGSVKKTKLVIGGEFDPDGAGSAPTETVYYPIVVNLAKQGTTDESGNPLASTATGYIDRNCTYSLTATICGRGTYDPEVDIVPVALALTVDVKDWELKITQNVEFN